MRTPAELAFSPDRSRVAFALHSTVADMGSFQPSHLYLIEGDGEPTPLTGGAWSDRTPVWSPDGSRLAFLSDRIMPGHQLPYAMVPGEEPVHVGTFVGSAESVAWSNDGTRLLVLVADPGAPRVGLERAGGERGRAGARPRDLRPGEARRRLFMLDLASGHGTEVGPPDTDIWEVDWDGDGLAVAIASVYLPGDRWYAVDVVRLDLHARAAHDAVRTDLADPSGWRFRPMGPRAAVTEGYASDHGLLNGSVKMVNVVDGMAALDPWPDLETVGIAGWIRRRSASVFEGRRDRDGLRPDVAGRAS